MSDSKNSREQVARELAIRCKADEYRKFDKQLDRIKKGHWLTYETGYVMAHAASVVLSRDLVNSTIGKAAGVSAVPGG